MKFLVDAQLPYQFVHALRDAGHDANHTLDLPLGNRTTDREICSIADRDQRVVVTKDADFVNTFLLLAEPKSLLLISTGNIDNPSLLRLLMANLDAIVEGFETSRFVELTRNSVIVH